MKTIQELQSKIRNKSYIIAIPITRLTSIKSLCEDSKAAQNFALHLSLKLKQKISEISIESSLTSEEWEIQKKIIENSIDLMQNYLESESAESRQSIHDLLRQIDLFQGNDYRKVHWNTTVHFVKSGYLIPIEYALRCFIHSDYRVWVYKLAREYVEDYKPTYGSGIIPESIPQLLEVAEFWCQYHFDLNLTQKFPKLMSEIASI
ncbi:MAG: hypothetical protein ACFBSE_26695 [Prochloraceae cyanobacterium]